MPANIDKILSVAAATAIDVKGSYSSSRMPTPASGGFGNGAGRLDGSGGGNGMDNRRFVLREFGYSSGAGTETAFGGLKFMLLRAAFSFSKSNRA